MAVVNTFLNVTFTSKVACKVSTLTPCRPNKADAKDFEDFVSGESTSFNEIDRCFEPVSVSNYVS